jgi:hypothetical protein
MPPEDRSLAEHRPRELANVGVDSDPDSPPAITES